MYATGDNQQRALAETAILDAQELRAQYIAQTLRDGFAFVKSALVSLKNAVHHAYTSTGFGHTA